MKERLPLTRFSRETAKWGIASTALSLSIINIFGANDAEAKPVFNLGPLKSELSGMPQSPVLSVSVASDEQPYFIKPIFDRLPLDYSKAFDEAIHQPMVELAVSTGDVNYIEADSAEPKFDLFTMTTYPAEDNGSFEVKNDSTIKKLTLEFTDGTADQSHRVFINSLTVRVAAFHEAVHGLNYEWWNELYNSMPVDTESGKRFEKINTACAPIDAWLYKTAVARMDNETYSIADIGNGCVSTIDMMNASDIGEDTFRCIDEGHMFQSIFKTPDALSGGHAYFNAFEFASSLTSILYFDPAYLKACLDIQDPTQVKDIVEYAKATLEMSFSHRPEIEKLLRARPETSDTIDFLMNYA